MGPCACAFRALFFSFAHKTHVEQQRTLCPTPKTIVFKNILRSGSSPSTEFYFPQKGRSVSNSYFFYSSKVYFIKIRIRFPILHVHTCIIRAIHSAQLPKLFTLWAVPPLYIFYYFYSFRYFIHICIILPIHFIKIRIGQSTRGEGALRE